ncbi:DUF4781 domain-containing protein [Terrihabitans sp. B22-R8]|uniref:DUF4781 domain-containing protein n=1 Tax=Terrihabitans sp. B22-R8 TaxID=3425128 RepID=UPI00403C60C5
MAGVASATREARSGQTAETRASEPQSSSFTEEVGKAQAKEAAPPPDADSEADARPASEQAPPPAPERQSRIDGWVDDQSDRSGGFLGIGGTSSSEKVVGALQGESDLGELSPSEQGYLVDRMLDRWDAGKGDSSGGAPNLANALDDAPELRAVVGERFALRAGELGKLAASQNPEDGWQDRMAARAMALDAVTALSGSPFDNSGSLGALPEVLPNLPPETAGNFARALTTGVDDPAIGASPALSRTLQALTSAHHTEATSAFVQNAFAHASSADYSTLAGDLPQQLGQALAREWNPDDPAAQSEDATRLTEIFASYQGQSLLAANDKIPLESRVNALATVRMDPGITAETLKETDDPWTNPAIVGPQAQGIAAQYLNSRGDAPQTLGGTDLDNSVGYAMGLPPTVPEGTDAADAEAAVARGELSYYGSGDHAETVKAVTDQIRNISEADNADVTVLPVMYSSKETGPIQLPLFRVTDPSGAERYVDNTGRCYNDFADWKANNKLPPGHMEYPEDGHLTADENGEVQLGRGNTPETADTFGEHLENFVDGAALVGGIVAGGVLIIGSGGLATPVVAAAGAVAVGAGAWGVYQGTSDLIDRSEHGQSINPFEDDQARDLWLNVGANAMAVGAFGSAARLAQLGKAGRAIAPIEASVHGMTQASAAVLDTAAIANQGIMLASHWDEMSAGERATSILSMGFWGAATMAGARATGSSLGDMFNPVKIRDNVLRSYAPAVAADPALTGNAVKIDFDPNTGVVQGIRHGADASQADIDLHVATAQNMQRSLTLEAQINVFFAGRDAPPPGSVGWAAKFDIGKINERMAARSAELETPDLSIDRRTELQAANEVDRQHLDDLAQDVESFTRDPAHAFVEARNTRFAARDTAAERQDIPVGVTTRQVGKNEVSWTVNENHETVSTEAIIREIPPKKERPSEENELTAGVGKEGGRAGAYPANDNGGHIIGFQFLHDQGLINMFPQNSEFNQQIYTQFETEMRGWVEAGGEVRVKVQTGSTIPEGGLGWGDARPSDVMVSYEVIDPDTNRTVYKNEAYFDNEQGQRFEGFEHSLGDGPDLARTRKGKIDLAEEMRKRMIQ